MGLLESGELRYIKATNNNSPCIRAVMPSGGTVRLVGNWRLGD